MKKDTLQQQFSFCHRGQETISLFLIISTIEKNASESRKMWDWYVKNIANTLHFSKISIIVFLLFHNNSIKIILCYKAEIKHLCTSGQFS